MWLLLLNLPQLSDASNPNAPQRLTWQVLSQTGEVVWSISKVAPPGTWWPDMTLDLCLLMAGLETWDIPEFRPDSLPVLSEATHFQRTAPIGCARPWSRCQLRLTKFYVCPRDGRPRKEARRCGGLEHFYCKEWGCETSGSAYWHPTSSWDLVTVSRNHSEPTRCPQRGRYVPTSSATCNLGPCNPVVIRFSEQGKLFTDWIKGCSWGIRFFVSGPDPGVVFSY